MPQDMGQWGGGNWAQNYGSVQPPSPTAPSPPAPNADPGIGGPLGNGQQNNTPFTTPASGTTLGGGGGGGGGGASQGSDSPWTGSMVKTADGPDWVGPEPSWTTSFDDGGVVGENDVPGPATDLEPAVTSVQKALAAGRQSMGIPASLFGEAGTDADGDNDGDQDSAVAGNIPQRPAAPGGEGPDQNPFPTKTPAIPFGKRMGAVDTGEQVAGNIPQRPAGPGGEGEDDNPFNTKTTPNPFGKRKVVPGAAQGGVIDAGDMDNPASAGMPTQPTTNQPAGSGAGQVNTQALKQYAMGAGAMPADQAMALEQKVDPQGQMDPAQRKLLAVQAAGDPQAQFGLLQHYRQRYNLLSAYARAAAQGSQDRPADLAESTQAATRAMHNVPTGHSVSFQPAGNGVAVSIKKLGGGKQQGLTGGGVVDVDMPQDSIVGGVPTPQDPATQESADQQGSQAASDAVQKIISIPDYIEKYLTSPWDKHAEKPPAVVLNEPAQGSAPGASAAANGGLGPMPSISQVASEASGLPSNPQFSAQPQGEQQPQGAQQPQAGAAQTGDSALDRTAASFPEYTPEMVKRAYYATGEIGSRRFFNYLEQLKSASVTNDQALTLERERAAATAALWKGKEAAITSRNENTVAGRLQSTMLNILGRKLTFDETNRVRMMGQQLAADPSLAKDPQKLMQRIAPLAVSIGANPRQFMQEFMQQQGGQGGGQQQGVQPQAGAPAPGTGVLRPNPHNPNQMMQRRPDGTWVPYEGQ